MAKLSSVFRTIPERCVKFHRRISVCPVKFAEHVKHDNPARRSAGAVRETRDMVEGALTGVRKGVESSESMAGIFGQLEAAVGEIVDLADEMRRAADTNGH